MTSPKTDFNKFSVGSVFNKVAHKSADVELKYKSVEVEYPSRLEAMALDPSKIVENVNLIYPAGQIDFSIGFTRKITVKASGRANGITITERTKRKPLVLHAAEIMRKALNVNHGLDIDVDASTDLRHCGLGSSSSLIAGVAAAINELYGNPIKALDLCRYCAQNHGEEIDDDPDNLMPVQCIGGSAVCGHFDGSLIVLAGQSTPIIRKTLSNSLKVVIGIPKNFEHPDSEYLMNAELDNIDGFKVFGEEHSKSVAYRLVHEVLPALEENNLKPCKDLIFDYRWNMGSIKNCSFAYPPMLDIAEKLRYTKDDEKFEIISLSSVGPGFFALTEDPGYVQAAFKKAGLKTHLTELYNDKYKVNKEQ